MNRFRILMILSIVLFAAGSLRATPVTLTFSEIPHEIANGNTYTGVTFNSPMYLYYNYISSGRMVGLTIPHPYTPFNYPGGTRINPPWSLQLDFDADTPTLGFDLSVWSHSGPMQGDILLSLFDSDGNQIGAPFDLFSGNTTNVNTISTSFYYSGAPVRSAEFDLVMYSSGFFEPSFEMDNLTFNTQPVPEPTTLILLGTGLAGLAFRRRLKNR